MTYDVVVDGKTHHVELERGEATWLCKVDGQELEVDAALTARDILSVLLDGKAYEIKRERSLRGELHMVIGSARYAVDVQDPRSLRSRKQSALRKSWLKPAVCSNSMRAVISHRGGRNFGAPVLSKPSSAATAEIPGA